MPELIDTHCHLNFGDYDADRDALLARAAEVGVRRVIIPAVDLDSVRASIPIAERYAGVTLAVGVHPNSTTVFGAADLTALRELAAHPKVIAVGEIGLDYYWDKSPKDSQRAAFESQLALATELELPVIIHNREASADLMPILERWAADLPESLKGRPGVLHSFSAPPDMAARALAAGFYLGFTGPITFKKADDLRRIAAEVPLDRILVETDGPFLTPHPYRGKRNEPSYIPYIVERLAALHQVSVEAMSQQTTQNAEQLFRLPTVG